MKINQNNPGFTIIEILVVMFILSIIMFMGSDFVISSFKSITFNEEQATAVETARHAINIMTQEIRGTNISERGDYPLSTVEEADLVFYNDDNGDGRMERIEYVLEGTILKKYVTLPGATNDYSGAKATSTLADYMNNDTEAIFNYYDAENNETDIINEIRLISVSLKINVTPWRAPDDVYVQSDVNLRNLKDN